MDLVFLKNTWRISLRMALLRMLVKLVIVAACVVNVCACPSETRMTMNDLKARATRKFTWSLSEFEFFIDTNVRPEIEIVPKERVTFKLESLSLKMNYTCKVHIIGYPPETNKTKPYLYQAFWMKGAFDVPLRQELKETELSFLKFWVYTANRFFQRTVSITKLTACRAKNARNEA